VLFRIFLFLLGFGLTTIGCVYIISYLNLLSIGYNFFEYVNFIIRRVECLNAIFGIIIMILTLIIGGKMNYIYDIYLNLNSTLYDFFDWNKNDKLMHIKKIPIFKINEENLIQIVNNSIKVDENFLNSVHNKTELWNDFNKLTFCALFCDYNNIIAIEFNNQGISYKKSFLTIDEELDILESTDTLKETNLKYNILKKDNIPLKTRKQLRDEVFINKELKNIDKNKLDYIHFECFGKHERNKKTMLNNIKKLSNNSTLYKKLYDILKLTSKTTK